MKSEDWSISPI